MGLFSASTLVRFRPPAGAWSALLAPEYDPHACEAEARALWAARSLPNPDGTVGTGDRARVWQFEGTFATGDREELIAQRAVAADIDARYLALAGRRAIGTLRRETFRGADPLPKVGPILESLGIWTGGAAGLPWDSAERPEGLQRMVTRLAHRGLLVVRDRSMRICPHCATPRTPERMIYREELGTTFLIRFAIRRGEREAHALAWVDAPWRLLGTSALLINPDLVYVLARHRRRGAEEWILTSRSSVGRLRGWIPGAELEVVEEIPGRELVGVPYGYPLRHEFPMGGTLTPPAGTLQPSRDVGDTGTGIVPLVPGHGGTDAQIAEALGIPGWPLVTAKGQMDLTLMHKYSGLDLRTADEFVVRDLAEGGATFAELKVRRGVPRCAICGSAMVWTPGRSWCLEPTRFPPELVALHARLLPGEAPLSQMEATWPASESTTSTDAGSVALRECAGCDRLEGPDGPADCTCGGRTRVISRRLLPSIGGTLNAWARAAPLPVSDTPRAYLGDRRRAPALIHHLAAIAALESPVPDLGLTLLPTVHAKSLAELVTAHGADAVRAAYVRSESSTRTTTPFGERVAQEHRRLDRWWRLAHEVISACDPSLLASFARPIAMSLQDLEPVDLALVARWERTRLQSLADFDRWAAGSAHRKLARFIDTDLTEYMALVRARLRQPGSPTSRQAALRALVHVVRGSTAMMGPICPHTAEAIHRGLNLDRASVFEQPPVGPDRALIDDARAHAWDRWFSVVRALRRFRRSLRLPLDTPLPTVAIVVSSDEVGDQYRASLATLEALARVRHLEIGSPRQPWAGRRRELRPIESEIQRVYPAVASPMIAILRRMPPRQVRDGTKSGEFSVVVGSNPYRLSPAMVGYTDTLPDGVVPVPWNGGEIYAEVPGGQAASAPPPLSPDAFWLVRKIQQRVRTLPPPSTGGLPVVIVSAGEPLVGELLAARERIAKYLGVSEVRVSAQVEEAAPPGRTWGRTRLGVRWWFHIPGAPARRRALKARPSRGRAPRVPEAPDDELSAEVDYADERIVAESEAIRNLGLELDSLLGLPLLGPAKVAAAWSAGLHSVDDYGKAPFEELVELPGFGRPVAERLRAQLGGDIPPRPTRTVRARRASFVARPEPDPAVLPASPAPLGMIAPAPAPTAPERPPPATIRASPSTPPSVPSEPGPTPDETPLPPEPSPTGPALPEDAPTSSPEVSEPAPILVIPGPVALSLEPPALAIEEPASPASSAPETPAIEAPAPPREDVPPSPVPEVVGTEPAASVPVTELPTEPAVRAAPLEGTQTTSESEPRPPSLPTAEGSGGLEAPTLEDEDSEVPEVEEIPEESMLPESIPLAGPTVDPAVSPPPETVAAVPDPSPAEPDRPAAGEVSDTTGGSEAGGAGPAVVPAEEPPISPAAGVLSEETSTAIEPPASGETPEPSAAPAPPSPEVVEAPSPEPAPAAGIEVMVGTQFLPSLERFLDATAAGHHGICIVREPPERIRAYVGARPVEIYWLTNVGRGQTLKPGDLDGLAGFLQRMLDEQRVTAFFIEGIEYLVQLHGIERLLGQFVAFDRSAREHDARAWVHLNPNLMASGDLQRIVALFAPAAPAGESRLPLDRGPGHP